jgi:methylglutaconyl-CoA hydratase
MTLERPIMPIIQEAVGRVLVVTIDNPQIKNAFDKLTIQQLGEVFDGLAFRDPLPVDIGSQPDVGKDGRYRPHVVVLQSSGDVFCAGAHLGEMKALGEADYQENIAAAMEMGAMFRSVRNCPVPVVARVQGPAYGGGVGLVAACDIVVAGPRAKFAFSEVRLGLVPGVISPLVIDRIGQAAARTCFLTGEPFEADEAFGLGLVDRLASGGDGPGGLDDVLGATVDSLLKGGAGALSLCKSLLEGTQSLGFNRSAELTARMIAEARTKPEAQAALASFLERKQAPWVLDEPWPGVPDTELSEEGDE